MPEPPEQVTDLFRLIAQSAPERRRALLDSLQPDTRRAVESLLARHGEDGRLQAAPGQSDFFSAETIDRGSRQGTPDRDLTSLTGAYHILRQLGEGGMGVVYEAEQVRPVRRQVALKLIKWGMDSKAVLARFESERQALALMNHRNIASVYDAGTTPDGRPYFAMEFVRGIPITDYCDKFRLTVKERLRLFIQVCEGIQHAHQKGIIHRDIKPSNVLVTVQDDAAVPKIIDFGVAKALFHRLTERTLATEFGQFIGTPAYMSPEQAEMTNLDIDTRSDVYSLGVLLYELLAGTQPLDLRASDRMGFGELQRRLREEEPPTPSARIDSADSTAAAWNRRTETRGLQRQLKGDLDWIAMKALEKDRTRRYETANALALDVQRHLDQEPVRARAPTVRYRLGKFVHRNRPMVVGVGGLLVVTIGLTTAYSINIARERQRAISEAATSKAVTDFLIGLFQIADPSESRGSSITAREILDRGARRGVANLSNAPLVEAKLLTTIAEVYDGLGLYSEAGRLMETTVLTLREHAPATGELMDALKVLADARWYQEEFHEAEALYREALSISEVRNGARHHSTLKLQYLVGIALASQGQLDEAERLAEETLKEQRVVLGSRHEDTLTSMQSLQNIYFRRARYNEAEEMASEALGSLRVVLGSDHPTTLIAAYNLARVFQVTGRYAEAVPLFGEVFDTSRQVLGQEHPDTVDAINRLVECYEAWGKPENAAEYRSMLSELQPSEQQ